MRPSENIEKLINKIQVEPRADASQRNIDDALAAHQKAKCSVYPKPNIWGIIMKKKITSLTAAAVFIFILLIGANLFTTTPIWAIEDTAQALQNIHSIRASAVFKPDSDNAYDFTLCIKAEPNNPLNFWVCAKSDEDIGVVRDNILYNYTIGSNEIYSYDIEEKTGIGFPIRLWQEVMKKAPFIIPQAHTMLDAFKNMTSNWKEVYKEDEVTKRNCVFVTGRFKLLSASFSIVFDLETKLVVRASYWTNPDLDGKPALDFTDIVYNQYIDDENFSPEKITDAEIINPQESKERAELWNSAIKLSRNDRDDEALEKYLELYDKYPQYIKTPEALGMIARHYRQTNQYEKAIEYLQIVPREYTFPKYAIVDAFNLLGLCYMETGRDKEALDSYEKCLMLYNQDESEGPNAEKFKEYLENQIKKLKQN